MPVLMSHCHFRSNALRPVLIGVAAWWFCVANVALGESGLPPDDSQALVNACGAKLQVGDPAAAVALCSKVLKSAAATEEQEAWATSYRGLAYFTLMKWDDSIRDFNRAIEMRPDYANLYNGRGMAYFFKKDKARALDDLDKAISINPNYAEAYRNRAGVNTLPGGDSNRALADWNKAIELDPDFADAYLHRGDIYLHSGDLDSAISDYGEVEKRQPNATDAEKLKGYALFFSGRYGESIDSLTGYLNNHLQIDDSTPIYFIYLAQRHLAFADSPELEWLSERSKPGTWRADLIRFLKGELSEGEILQIAGKADAAQANARSCLAEYYIGEANLIHDDRAGAEKHFRAADRTCAENSVGDLGARAALRRLN